MLRIVSCAVAVAVCACTQSQALQPSEPQGPAGADAGSSPTTADVAIELEPCEPGSWCWVHGTPLQAIHGASAESVFAVGAQGTILEWAQNGWHKHAAV